MGVAPHSTMGTFYVRPVTPLPCCPGVCDPASWLRTFDQGRWRRWGQRGPARPVSTVLRSAAGFQVALPGVRGRPPHQAGGSQEEGGGGRRRFALRGPCASPGIPGGLPRPPHCSRALGRRGRSREGLGTAGSRSTSEDRSQENGVRRNGVPPSSCKRAQAAGAAEAGFALR